MSKLLGIMFAFFMVSCAVQNPFETDTIQGKWELVSLNGEKIKSRVANTTFLAYDNNTSVSFAKYCQSTTDAQMIFLFKMDKIPQILLNAKHSISVKLLFEQNLFLKFISVHLWLTIKSLSFWYL